MSGDATSLSDWLSQMDRVRVNRLFQEAPDQAAAWVRALALEGNAQAQVCYGRMLLEGTHMPKNEREALRWFERGAARGDLDAINLVGRCRENGWGCDADAALAAVHYHAAADAGHDWARYNLGHLYLDGLGVTRDADRAYRYYLGAANQGHARAMNLVGRCCEEGWGTPQDFHAAACWYQRSAAAGYFRGQYNWASILLKCQRADQAAPWFERAATAGNPGVHRAVLQIASTAAAHHAMATLAERLRGSPTHHSLEDPGP